MKKYMMFLALSALVLSSCGTYTGQGAYAGATFGSILGSAIGAAADKKEAEQYEAYQRQRAQRRKQKSYGDDIYYGGNDNASVRVNGNNSSNRVNVDNDSGFDPSNSGDDRIDFDGAGPASISTSTSSSKKLPFSYQPLQQ